MIISRRQAREWVIQMLTAADLNPPADIKAFIEDFWAQIPTLEEAECGTDGSRVKGKVKAFAENLVEGVLTHLSDIDGVLGPLVENWDLYRLGTVERAVLRLGIWEISHGDAPVGIVINEAIDLANWFSTPKSRNLVNAVLDNYAKSR